ncbi:MAG: GNAT family N-acetyltransferase [Cyanobium sp.]
MPRTTLNKQDLQRRTPESGGPGAATAPSPLGQQCGDDPVCVALGPQDLEACLALDQLSLGGFWNREQWRQELESPQRPAVGLRRGEALLAVACAWLVLDELHITLVAVHPEQRRRGLGHLVLQRLLERGGALGATRATLEVATTNSAACHLYSRCGFRTAGIRRDYYRNGDDALIQWLTLSSQGLRGDP